MFNSFVSIYSFLHLACSNMVYMHKLKCLDLPELVSDKKNFLEDWA